MATTYRLFGFLVCWAYDGNCWGWKCDPQYMEFSEPPHWNVIWPGRAAKLELRGIHGALDLWALYFHTGATVSEQDLHGVFPAAIPRCTSFAAIREHMRSRVGRAIAHRSAVLTVLAGDFNWVVADDDRRSISTMEVSGARDRGEEWHFRKTVLTPHGLHELYQADFTHRSGLAWSRLDRIYCNQHVTEQLDRDIRVTAMEWRPELTNHRAVGFSKCIPDKRQSSAVGVSAAAVRHQDFPRRVKLKYYALLRCELRNYI